MKGIAGLATSLLGLWNTSKAKEMGFYRTKAGVELKPLYQWAVRTPTSCGMASGPIGYLPYYEIVVKQIAEEGSRRRSAVYNGGIVA